MLRLLVIAALLIAAMGLGLIAYRAITPPPTRSAEPPRQILREVVVMQQDRPAGSLLTDADLALKPMPANAVPPDALPASALKSGRLKGAMLRSPVGAQQTVRRSDILQPGDRGFLAAVLAPGARAISIAVDAVTGAAGLIVPGDRVDLILTQSGSEDLGERWRIAAEDILSNVRVIAVDQRLVSSPGGSEKPVMARTVTLEVSPDQALRVAVAQQLGRISLVVRPVEPSSEKAARGDAPPVYAGDVSKVSARPAPSAAASASRPRARPTMTIIQGGEVRQVSLP